MEGDTDEEIFIAIMERVLNERIEADTTNYQVRRGGFDRALKLAPLVARSAYRQRLDGAVFDV